MSSESRLLEPAGSYDCAWDGFEDLSESFSWTLPDQFNVAEAICRRASKFSDRPAIRTVGSEQTERTYTYRQLADESDRLADSLRTRGVGRGDRMAIHTTQRPEVVTAHLAAWKLGAVSVVLNPLLGLEEALSQLRETEATVWVVDAAVFESDASLVEAAGSETSIVVVGDRSPLAGGPYRAMIEDGTTDLDPVDTTPDDDALVVFTSGTTGEPKGVVHTHSVVLGHLPTYYLTFTNADPASSRTFWTVSNWASITLVSNVLTPLFAGRTVVAHARTSRFDPAEAAGIVTDYDVTNLSASPTGLRMLKQVPDVQSRLDGSELAIITTGGEEVSDSLVDWWSDLGVTVQEIYGQTEANNVVADCTRLLDLPSKAIGRPMPGHEVTILDPDDPEVELEDGTVGEIAVRSDDPICFDRYWERPERSAESIQSGWLLTGDLGYRTEAGAIVFESRKDDVIITSGHRVAPAEVEDALVSHPSVVDAGVVGVDDEVRGEIPKAFVQLEEDVEPSDTFANELREHVKDRTATYKRPHEVTFLGAIPKTNTGTTARGELRELANRNG